MTDMVLADKDEKVDDEKLPLTANDTATEAPVSIPEPPVEAPKEDEGPAANAEPA
jgi:hypothetical protein